MTKEAGYKIVYPASAYGGTAVEEESESCILFFLH